MANQIGISPKQSIAALHAQGASNRQIAALLNPHRDRVNRHVRLLKIQNQPVAPPGDFSGIPLADTAQPECVARFGVGGSVKMARCSLPRLGTSPSVAPVDRVDPANGSWLAGGSKH